MMSVSLKTVVRLFLSLFADLSFPLLSNIKLNMSKADYKAAYSY